MAGRARRRDPLRGSPRRIYVGFTQDGHWPRWRIRETGRALRRCDAVTVFSEEERAAVRTWLSGKAMSIYGGSFEIQNNIISKNILGLPETTQKG